MSNELDGAILTEPILEIAVMSPVRTKQQTSSGGIVYRYDPNGLYIALIHRTTPEGRMVWCLPKGWVEPGETLQETA